MESQHRPAPSTVLCLASMLICGALTGTGAAADHPTLVDPEKTNCETCHDEVVAVRVPHPPAVDDCLTCHVFEAGDGETNVGLMESGSALCLACHDGLTAAANGEVAAPHAPVVDDCGTCHGPHGSEFDAMLTVEPGEVCAQCHDADDTDAAHPIPVRRADCRTCHEAHGSANTHMLRGSSQHVPFEEGSCDACHRTPRGTRVRLLQEGELSARRAMATSRATEMRWCTRRSSRADAQGATIPTSRINHVCSRPLVANSASRATRRSQNEPRVPGLTRR